MYYSKIMWQNRNYYLVFDDKGLHEITTEMTLLIEQATYQKNSIYKEQLLAYFNNERQVFDMPLCLAGTPFQQAVWQALLAIPYGETRSYEDIAIAIGKPKAVRAVGGAIGKNPILIVVPCHRVIGKNGHLTGFSSGIDLKKALLTKEKITYKA